MLAAKGNAAEVPGTYVPWLAFVPSTAPGAQSIKAQSRLGGSAEARERASGVSWSATLDCSWGSSTSTGCSRRVDGTTRYLLDGLSVIAQYAPDGQRQAWYTQSLARIDEVLNVANDSGKFWYQADALGSLYGLTNQGGALIGNQNYEVFGAPTPAPTGPAGQPFGFTGREHELDSGLVYARHRYLIPGTGRWDRADPLGMPDGPNSYAYVPANPATYRDPLGLFATAIHHHIINTAFSRLSGEDRASLMSASDDADSLLSGQGPEGSYKHAMLDGLNGQMTEEGEQLYQDFVAGQMARAAALELSNACGSYGKSHAAAIYQLGLGMHAVMDHHSPFHAGQPWFGIFPPRGVWLSSQNFAAVWATQAYLGVSHKLGEDKISESDPSVRLAIVGVSAYYNTYKSVLGLAQFGRVSPDVLFGIAVHQSGDFSF